MKTSIEYDKSLGDAALALKILNPVTKLFYDFVAGSWGALNADCLVPMIEMPSDGDDTEAVYAANFTCPTGGPYVQIAVLVSTGAMIASDLTDISSILAPDSSSVVAGTNTRSKFAISPISGKAATGYWKECFLTFTAGTLAGQTKLITAYDGTYITVEGAGYTGIPQAGDTFILVNR